MHLSPSPLDKDVAEAAGEVGDATCTLCAAQVERAHILRHAVDLVGRLTLQNIIQIHTDPIKVTTICSVQSNATLTYAYL